MADVNAILDRCTGLASVPGVAVRAVSLLASNDYDLSELEAIIRTDEGIMAAVVRTANSVAHGVSGQSFSLEQSIVRLGSKNLRRIVLGQQSGAMLLGAGRAYGLRRLDLWRNALGGAIAGEMLASESGVCDPGEAYVAALLRDIGKLAIDTTFPNDVFASADGLLVEREGFEQAERAILGIDHAELGAALASRWGLPDRVIGVIQWHHAPPAPGEPGADPMIDVVHAADVIALLAGLGLGDDGLAHRIEGRVRETLELTRPRLERTVAEVWSAVEELQKMIHDQPDRGMAS